MDADTKKRAKQQGNIKTNPVKAQWIRNRFRLVRSAIEFLGTHPFATGFLALLSLIGFAISVIQYYQGASDAQEAHEQADRIERKVENADRKATPEYLANFRTLLSEECAKNKDAIYDMFENKRQTGLLSFNAYRLPEFSETIRVQFTNNPALMELADPEMPKILKALGYMDYQHVFAQKDPDGTIWDGAIRKYILEMHTLCDWVGIDLGHREYFKRE